MRATGAIAITLTAISGGQSCPKPPAVVNCAMPTLSVNFESSCRQDQLPVEVVPRPLEAEDHDRGERRAGKRQHDAPVGLEEAGVVELRGLLVVLRDRQEVLAHEEEVGRVEQMDEDVSLVGRDQVPVEDREVREDLEDGDEPHLVGDHQRGEHEHEERLAKREPEARERVAAQRAEEDVRQRDRDREDRAVHEVAVEGAGGEGLAVAVERRVMRDQHEALDALRERLEGRRKSPEERQQVEDREREEERIEDELPDERTLAPARDRLRAAPAAGSSPSASPSIDVRWRGGFAIRRHQ